MEALFIIGTILLIIAICTTIGAVVFAVGRLEDAKSEDFLEKYYEDQADEPH